MANAQETQLEFRVLPSSAPGQVRVQLVNHGPESLEVLWLTFCPSESFVLEHRPFDESTRCLPAVQPPIDLEASDHPEHWRLPELASQGSARWNAWCPHQSLTLKRLGGDTTVPFDSERLLRFAAPPGIHIAPPDTPSGPRRYCALTLRTSSVRSTALPPCDLTVTNRP